MRICSVDGCNEKHKAKSFCKRHYYSFRLYGNPLLMSKRKTNTILDWNKAKPYLQNNGYIILRCYANNKIYNKLEHRYVWEKNFGKIPNGYRIHHINEIKTDNRIENLQMVDSSTHKKIHIGWKQIDGEWYKKCWYCNIFLKVNSINFHKNSGTKDGLASICRPCSHKKYLVERNKKHIKEAI